MEKVVGFVGIDSDRSRIEEAIGLATRARMRDDEARADEDLSTMSAAVPTGHLRESRPRISGACPADAAQGRLPAVVTTVLITGGAGFLGCHLVRLSRRTTKWSSSTRCRLKSTARPRADLRLWKLKPACRR